MSMTATAAVVVAAAVTRRTSLLTFFQGSGAAVPLPLL